MFSGIRGRLTKKSHNTADATVSEVGEKVGIDVNIVGGSSGGGGGGGTTNVDFTSTNSILTNILNAFRTLRTSITGDVNGLKSTQNVGVTWGSYFLTYVPAGQNGAGEVQTITYFTSRNPRVGSNATSPQQTTFTYDANNNVLSVSKNLTTASRRVGP